MVDTGALRKEMVRVCRKLSAKGLIAASDGNVSCRAGNDLLLITPGGRSKGSVEPPDLLLVDHEGTVHEGAGKPSSELRMHLLAYRRRPDVNAVVHAHPPMLTALTLAGIPFRADVLPEVWLTIGPVPTAPYATPLHRRGARIHNALHRRPPGRPAGATRLPDAREGPGRSVHAARKARARRPFSFLCPPASRPRAGTPPPPPPSTQASRPPGREDGLNPHCLTSVLPDFPHLHRDGFPPRRDIVSPGVSSFSN